MQVVEQLVPSMAAEKYGTTHILHDLIRDFSDIRIPDHLLPLSLALPNAKRGGKELELGKRGNLDA